MNLKIFPAAQSNGMQAVILSRGLVEKVLLKQGSTRAVGQVGFAVLNHCLERLAGLITVVLIVFGEIFFISSQKIRNPNCNWPT